jgi:DNA-binding MarR family transcriptional regulator
MLNAVKHGYSQTDMASLFNISEAAVSKNISGLMEKKLLKKKAGEDKRSWDVSLTAQGKKILTSVHKQLRSELEDAIKALPQKEQMDLESGLKALENLMHSLREEACNVSQKSAKTKRNK